MTIDKKIKVQQVIYSLDKLEKNKHLVANWNPTNDKVAADFYVKIHPNKPNHSILVASRFNSNNVEPNPPFPGWFFQLVGNTFSLGFGDGKTWNSVKTAPVEVNKWYHVAFSLDNQKKRAEVYLNGEMTFKEGVTFKKPCNTLVVGALIPNGGYKFAGEIKDLKLGDTLIKIEKRTDQETLDIKVCLNNLLLIKENLTNIENDIKSLDDILAQIESWKLRGLEIDTQLLEKQIETMQKKLSDFNNEFKKEYLSLKDFDNNIKPNNNNNNKDLFENYKLVLQNLIKDMEVLDNAIDELSEFKELGVKLGTAFESITAQKELIKKVIKDTENKLQKKVEKTIRIMDVVNL